MRCRLGPLAGVRYPGVALTSRQQRRIAKGSIYIPAVYIGQRLQVAMTAKESIDVAYLHVSA